MPIRQFQAQRMHAPRDFQAIANESICVEIGAGKGRHALLFSGQHPDKKLIAISDEIENLPSEIKAFALHPSGVFNYRKISNTNRLSVHSFGIAIDLNIKDSHYWIWDKAKGNMKYKNKIPFEIVEIFEKHGFIWGGRWYHYDTMHFEYRPELLAN